MDETSPFFLMGSHNTNKLGRDPNKFNHPPGYCVNGSMLSEIAQEIAKLAGTMVASTINQYITKLLRAKLAS